MPFKRSTKTLGYFCLMLTGAAAGATDHAKSIETLVKGNTLIISNRYGPAFLHFDPSGKFTSSSPDGSVSRGTWRATEDSVCSTTEPTPEGKVFPEHCMHFSNRKIDQSWTSEDPRNGKIGFKLVQGKHPAAKD